MVHIIIASSLEVAAPCSFHLCLGPGAGADGVVSDQAKNYSFGKLF